MKAAVYYEPGGPEVLRYEDIPDPVAAPDGVIIEVEAISIEGADTQAHRYIRDASKPPPYIFGYQCSGTIREVGSAVTNREVGQRVTCNTPTGSHCELVKAPAMWTWPVPDGFNMQHAACVPMAFSAADACLFEYGELQAGETVLVQAGASGVGLAAIQLAKRAGATVLATASSDDKLERLGQYGLDHGINYLTHDLVAEVQRLTEGKGVDLVVDGVGSTLASSIAALGYGGRVSYVGNAGRPSDLMIDVSSVMLGNKRLQGVFLGREMAEGGPVLQNIERLIGEVAKGELTVVVDRTFLLSEAAAAHAYIDDRRAFGRVVLVP